MGTGTRQLARYRLASPHPAPRPPAPRHPPQLTYPLHIIIRYELEKALVEGSVQLADLPRLWNEVRRPMAARKRSCAASVLAGGSPACSGCVRDARAGRAPPSTHPAIETSSSPLSLPSPPPSSPSPLSPTLLCRRSTSCTWGAPPRATRAACCRTCTGRRGCLGTSPRTGGEGWDRRAGRSSGGASRACRCPQPAARHAGAQSAAHHATLSLEPPLPCPAPQPGRHDGLPDLPGRGARAAGAGGRHRSRPLRPPEGLAE